METTQTPNSAGSPPPPTHVDKANRYIDQVLSGAIPACKYVRQACQRQRDDLERFRDHEVFRFDEEKAGHAARFIERLPHIKGPKASAGELIVLEDWQCFVVTTVFGWRRKDTGGRRFRRGYVEVPRGNGKSCLSSGVALYGLLADGEAGPEIYSAATTREQAAIVFNDAKAMLRKRDAFRERLGAVVNQNEILRPATDGRFVPLARDAHSLDGKNVHVAVVDELHAHKTREVYDVIETATSKRLASLLWCITTAGTDTAGICYEVRGYCVKLLARVAQDEAQFGIIFTIDDGDDWLAESSWRKANPNWGVSVMPDAFASLAAKAAQLPSAQNNFKTKHLDVWCNADQAWMDPRAWDRAADPELDPDAFAQDECFLGLDLASKIDIAAKVRLFRRQRPANRGLTEEDVTLLTEHGYPPETVRHYYAFLQCYLPEEAARDGRNSQYSGWEKEGLLRTTPGDVLDFAQVKHDVLDDAGRFQVAELAYDPWQATQLSQELANEGLTCVEVRPTVQNFSAPMKELDALVRSGRFHHDGNPILRWMISNVVCHLDANDNIFPRKERPENKIDGVVAIIMALARAMVAGESAYSGDRGLLSL